MPCCASTTELAQQGIPFPGFPQRRSVMTVTFASHWGHHPCDYPTYLVLKELHQHYLEALRQRAAWERWHRKLPHNRQLRRRLRADDGNPVGWEVLGPWPEPCYCA